MEIVCKVLKNNKIYFKCDTFWTLSPDVTNAKTHSLEKLPQLLIKNYLTFINRQSKNKSKYDGVKIGYDEVLEKKGFDVLKTKRGEWIFRFKYIADKDEIIVVDASRLAKLKELQKSINGSLAQG